MVTFFVCLESVVWLAILQCKRLRGYHEFRNFNFDFRFCDDSEIVDAKKDWYCNYAISRHPFWCLAVAYAGFWKRGRGGKLQKIWEEHRSEFDIVILKFRPIFRPKSGEEQKKKVFTQISFHFSPKIKWFRAQSLMHIFQRGGGMPQFCSLFYAILQSWRPNRGRPLLNAPP